MPLKYLFRGYVMRYLFQLCYLLFIVISSSVVASSTVGTTYRIHQGDGSISTVNSAVEHPPFISEESFSQNVSIRNLLVRSHFFSQIELVKNIVIPNGDRFVVYLYRASDSPQAGAAGLTVSGGIGSSQLSTPTVLANNGLSFSQGQKGYNIAAARLSDTEIMVASINWSKRPAFSIISRQINPGEGVVVNPRRPIDRGGKANQIRLPYGLHQNLNHNLERIFLTYLKDDYVALTAESNSGNILFQLFDRTHNNFRGRFRFFNRFEGNYHLHDVVADAEGNLTYFITNRNNNNVFSRQRNFRTGKFGDRIQLLQSIVDTGKVTLVKGGVSPNGHLRACYLTTNNIARVIKLSSNNTTPVETGTVDDVSDISSLTVNVTGQSVFHYKSSGNNRSLNRQMLAADGSLGSNEVISSVAPGAFPDVISVDSISQKIVNEQGVSISPKSDQSSGGEFIEAFLRINELLARRLTANFVVQKVSKTAEDITEITPKEAKSVSSIYKTDLFRIFKNNNLNAIDGNADSIYWTFSFAYPDSDLSKPEDTKQQAVLEMKIPFQ